MPSDAIVQIAGLTHNYGARRALDGIGMTVPRASLFGLLGPNGSGKTTLLKILATLITPRDGEAAVAGADVRTEPHAVRRSVGVVFQRPGLDGKLSALENLRHQGHLYGLYGRSLRARSDELLLRFGVAGRSREPVEQLSGGMQRRVELAKAMLHDPVLLLLDEAGSSLDPSGRTIMMDHLQRLRDERGVTALISTHLAEEADRCEQLAILDHGKLVALDTPAALKAKVGGDVVTLTPADPLRLAEKVHDHFGVRAMILGATVRVIHAHGHQFVTRLIEGFPGDVERATVGKPTLNDVFIHLTGHGLDNHYGGVG